MVARRLTIETVDNVSRLICQRCRRPFLEIKGGEVKLLNKHGASQHENTLSFDDLRMLSMLVYQQAHPTERW